MLVAVDDKVDLKITVLDAMRRLKTAWNNVTETTVRNCFAHVGFKAPNPSETAEIEAEAEAEPNITAVLEDLRSSGVNVDFTELQNFTGADEGVATSG